VKFTSAPKSASIMFVTNTSASESSTLQFPPPAPWLADVQRRLSNSIGVMTATASDGQWLSSDVVSAANLFFQATSDMLPAEPYLHSSLQGDLVAEFKSAHGPMTMIVSNRYALAMATINGEPVQSKVALTAAQPSTLRAELAKITDALRAGKYGSVDPAK